MTENKQDKKYKLVDDHEGCWYLIPAEKLARWFALTAEWIEGTEVAVPDWATCINGPVNLVTFENPSID